LILISALDFAGVADISQFSGYEVLALLLLELITNCPAAAG